MLRIGGKLLSVDGVMDSGGTDCVGNGPNYIVNATKEVKYSPEKWEGRVVQRFKAPIFSLFPTYYFFFS